MFRMLEPKPQVSVYQGDESPNVFNQVSSRSLYRVSPVEMLTVHRQVQDLQSQIAELTHVNSQLRTQVSDQNTMDVNRTDLKRRHSETHPRVLLAPRQISAPVLDNFDRVRSSIREHAHSVFSTPHQNSSRPAEPNWPLPDVPSRADYAYLSRSFVDTIHAWYPAVHWPTFQHKVDQVYASRSFEGCSREWVGLFFAVLACGSLHPRSEHISSRDMAVEGQAMFETAASALQPWSEELTITHGQVALMLSIFATESNRRSLGSVWLASAVRVVQELQISPEMDCWSAFDGEIRRRLWWSTYVRDRCANLPIWALDASRADCAIGLCLSRRTGQCLSTRVIARSCSRRRWTIVTYSLMNRCGPRRSRYTSPDS